MLEESMGESDRELVDPLVWKLLFGVILPGPTEPNDMDS